MTDEILRRWQGQSEKKRDMLETTPVVKDGKAVRKRKKGQEEVIREGQDRCITDKVQTGSSAASGRKGREETSEQMLTGKGSDDAVEGAPPAKRKARARGGPSKKKLNAPRGPFQVSEIHRYPARDRRGRVV